MTTDEALEQVRWLLECGMVDFIEISGWDCRAVYFQAA